MNMNQSIIQKIGEERQVDHPRENRPGIFMHIRDGKFDASSWDAMISTLRSITTPLSDNEAATLSRHLWLVPILMITKQRYMEQRGFSADDLNKRRGELEHEMWRLIGPPGRLGPDAMRRLGSQTNP